MLFTFKTAVFTLLTLASLFDAVSSQAFPYSIPSSSFSLVGPPGLNFTSFDELYSLGFDWDMVDADGYDVNFVWTEVDATVELMSGPSAQALNSSVMQPLSTSSFDDVTYIDLPPNLPNGAYHLRVTSVVNTTITSTTIQTLTADGADLHWTRPNTGVGCGPGLQPNPFVPIKDVNDPRFTSFVLVYPYAGQNYPLVNYSNIQPGWDWRIRNNWGAEGITSVEVQVLNATSGIPVLENAIPVNADTLEGFSSLALNPVELGLQANAQYMLQFKYVNTVQDGPVLPGAIVTYIGDMFNVVPSGVDCDAQNLLLDSPPVSSSSVRSSSAAPSSSRPVASSSSSHVPSSASAVARSSSIVVSSRPSASSAPVRPSSSISIHSGSSNPISVLSSHPSSTPTLSNSGASSAPVRPSSISIHSASSNPVSVLSSHPSSTSASSNPSASSAPIRASSLSHTPSVSSTHPASNTGLSDPKSSATPSTSSATNKSSPSSGPSSSSSGSASSGTGNNTSPNTGSGDGTSDPDSGSAPSDSSTGTTSSDPESGSTSPTSGSAGSGNDSSDPGSESDGGSPSTGKSTSNAGSGTSKQSGDGEPKHCKKKHAHKYKHQNPPHRHSESYGDHADSF
ncbi:hypothetical protein B0H12DRAFT_1329348 [Mycena haematopus]|nr:hypothetical protein B0H12DRAFT_1329348 [Mycena haematopus]